MSLSFKMDPHYKRNVSVPSDSCQVDFLIYERWAVLLRRLHCVWQAAGLANIRGPKKLPVGMRCSEVRGTNPGQMRFLETTKAKINYKRKN